MTTHEYQDMYARIEQIAKTNQLSLIFEIIPYMIHRQSVANDYIAAKEAQKLDKINYLNEQIQKALFII